MQKYEVCLNHLAPGLVCICIDSDNAGDGAGRLYHRYNKEATTFRSLLELVLELDRLFDETQYPQASTEARSFYKRTKASSSRKEAKKITNEADFPRNRGELATFMIRVQFRQNATWQGEVLWIEKNQKVSFRSALELLKLIDGVLNEEMDQELNQKKTS